jgi:hypothetical protein
MENNSGIEVVWDETVNELAEKAKTMTNYIGPLGEREFVEVNLRKILESMQYFLHVSFIQFFRTSRVAIRNPCHFNFR